MVRVEVLWADDDGTPRVAPATLDDRSQSGVSVRIKNPIRVGSHVTVKWAREEMSGTVMNCRREKKEYILGVKRDSGKGNDQT